MIGVLCFILPIVLFIITFPLKALLKMWEMKVKSGSGDTLADSLGLTKGITDSVRSGIRVKQQTVKATKGAKKVVVNSTKIAIGSIKLTIRALKALVMLLRSLGTFLLSLGATGVIILVMVVLMLVAALASVTLFETNIKPTPASAKSEVAGGMGTGYDYSVVNWGADFSSNLDSIEGTYGKNARDWTELIILSMRTEKGVKMPVQNWWAGFKIVESGAEVMRSDQGGQHPLTDFSYVCEYNNGWNCFGPMQIQLQSKSVWCRNNADYIPRNTSPSSDSRESDSGSIFFYPDLCLGTSTRLSELVDECISNSEAYYYVDEAFSKLGITPTEEKKRKVFLVLTSMAYNCGYIPTNSLKTFFLPEAKAVAYYMILFFEKYGYDYNSKQANLFKSMFSDACVGESSIVLNREAVSSKLVGKGSAFTLEQSGDYGVLSPDGDKQSGTLLSYLLSGASEEVRGIVSYGMQNHWGGGANGDICYYGFSNYACAFFTVDKAVDLLGLRSQLGEEKSSGGGIFETALLAGKTGTNEGVDRLKYVFGGDGEYSTDCSRFMLRILVGAKVNAFGLSPASVMQYSPSFNVVSSNTYALSLVIPCSTYSQMDWVHNNAPDSIVWEGSAFNSDVVSKLQPGDILYRSEHVVMYMGKNKSGVDYIVHASHTGGTNCSVDPDNLCGGYSVGFAPLSYGGGYILAVRPSKFK